MASNPDFVQYVADQCSGAGEMSVRKMCGDWENDPENASKVVDENGEPMVVYHGSNWRPSLIFEMKGESSI